MYRPFLSVFLFVSIFTFFAIPVYAALVNINTASQSELVTLNGIGDVKAQAIIDYRNSNGSFTAIEDIVNVSGIGTATFENIKNNITVGSVSVPASEEETSQEESQTSPESSSSGGGIFIEDSNSISMEIGEDRTILVGADSVFEVVVFGTKGEPLENPRVVWSFGDGTRKEGKKVLHHFAFPGTYVVIADAVSAGYSASARLTVTAVPAALSITQVTNEYIALKNNGDVEVNLGGWFLFSLGRQFQFPQNTIVLADQEVLISNKRTNLSGVDPSTVALQYPNGLVATAYEYPLFISSPGAVPTGTVIDRPRGEVLSASSEGEPLIARENLITAPVVATGAPGSFWMWVIGVFGIATVGSGALLYTRRRQHGWAVEEI